MKRHGVPSSLTDVYFDFHWSQEKLWALPLEPTRMPIAELEWALELPVLASAPPERIYDLAPAALLRDPSLHPAHQERIARADLRFPLHVMWWKERWLVMDGFHRLLRLKREGAEEALVLQVPPNRIPELVPEAGTAADFLAGELKRRG